MPEWELSSGKMKWNIWVLSEEDIDWIAKGLGLKLTKTQKREVARRFKKGVEGALYDWDRLLENCIYGVIKDAKKN